MRNYTGLGDEPIRHAAVNHELHACPPLYFYQQRKARLNTMPIAQRRIKARCRITYVERLDLTTNTTKSNTLGETDTIGNHALCSDISVFV